MTLNAVNPNLNKNGLRRFTVTSEDIGTDDIGLIAKQAAICIPDPGWELHKVYSSDNSMSITMPYLKI